MSGIRARGRGLCASLQRLPNLELTLAESRVGVNALRLTRRWHVVHVLNGLFADKCGNISREKIGTEGG
jgi:hypothetical protein